MNTYKGRIEKLEPHQVAVCPTNTEGRHGMGFALWCYKNAGAIRGQASGIMGQSYGIVTKDLTKDRHPSVPVENIINSLSGLYVYASFHPDKEFLVPYNTEDRYLNGYTPYEMAAMFATLEVSGRTLSKKIGIDFPGVPPNILFEEGFAKLIEDGVKAGMGYENNTGI